MTRKFTPQELLHRLIGAPSAGQVVGPNEARLLADLDARMARGLIDLHFSWGPAARSMSREQLAGLILDHLDLDVGAGVSAASIDDFAAELPAA